MLLQILLFNTAGEPGPPPLLIAVADEVPARLLKVIMLADIESAASAEIPDVVVNDVAPELATRSTFIVLPLILTSTVTEASWKTPVKVPVLRIVDPVVFSKLFVTLTVPCAALTLI